MNFCFVAQGEQRRVDELHKQRSQATGQKVAQTSLWIIKKAGAGPLVYLQAIMLLGGIYPIHIRMQGVIITKALFSRFALVMVLAFHRVAALQNKVKRVAAFFKGFAFVTGAYPIGRRF